MRIVKLLIVKDEEHDNLISVIPSSYFLCRMYDNKSVKFKIEISKDEDDNPVLEFRKVFIRFISGNVDVGSAEVFNIDENYEYELSGLYTQKSNLSIQLVFIDNYDNEIRTNIIKFNLSNSLPKDKEFYLDLSYLNRLVFDKVIKLEVDYDYKELIIFDDMENELCRIDIDYLLEKIFVR